MLFCISCKSQITYKEETLKSQSQNISILVNKHHSTTSKNSTIKTKDILETLKVKPIQYSASPDSNENEKPGFIKTIILEFFTDAEFRYKMDNKIKLYNIYIHLKQPLKESETLPLLRKSKGLWNDEVERFYRDMEVKDIKIYDLEK